MLPVQALNSLNLLFLYDFTLLLPVIKTVVLVNRATSQCGCTGFAAALDAKVSQARGNCCRARTGRCRIRKTTSHRPRHSPAACATIASRADLTSSAASTV